MQALAKLNNCPTSPRKMRLIVDMIRGQRVEKALFTLKFNNRQMYASYVEKLLKSAIANWEQINPGARVEESALFVKTVFVDGGPVAKRMRPAPQGRGYRIRKRSNHITLVVDSQVQSSGETVEEVTETEN